MNYRLISYAMDFTSFLLEKTSFNDKIRNIILFGSVARSEESPNSDIDIFIDVIEENKKIESDINKCIERFFESGKYKNYWKLLDINNNISLKIGSLDNWKDLHSSIASNGILLYGKFKYSTKEGKNNSMLIWENIKPNSKRVLFNKQIFGYNQNKKFYRGLLQKYNGERLGKGCIVIPSEHFNIFHSFFKKNKITVKIKKFIEY